MKVHKGISEEPTFIDGIIDFHMLGKKVQIFKLLTNDESTEIIENGNMCSVCMLRFQDYEELDET